MKLVALCSRATSPTRCCNSAGQSSGTLAPRVEDGKPVTHQVQDLQGFRILLQQQYPEVAKQFPAPPSGG